MGGKFTIAGQVFVSFVASQAWGMREKAAPGVRGR